MSAKTFYARTMHKRDTAANWQSSDPVLLYGEVVIVDTSSGQVRTKTGDGSKTFSQLPFDDEAIYAAIEDAQVLADEAYDHANTAYRKANTASNNAEAAATAVSGKADASTSVDITLTAGEWDLSSQMQVVKASGMTNSVNGMAGLSSSATTAQIQAAQSAGIIVAGQDTNYIIFTYTGTKPTVDIPVTVVMVG